MSRRRECTQSRDKDGPCHAKRTKIGLAYVSLIISRIIDLLF